MLSFMKPSHDDMMLLEYYVHANVWFCYRRETVNSQRVALVYSYPVTVNQILLSIYSLNCQPALGPNMVNIIMLICCKNLFSLV